MNKIKVTFEGENGPEIVVEIVEDDETMDIKCNSVNGKPIPSDAEKMTKPQYYAIAFMAMLSDSEKET
jgi:hypothetical protein